jgi:hypothetical protein
VIEFSDVMRDIHVMKSTPKTAPRKVGQRSRKKLPSGIIGYTYDGVAIQKPPRATHFTARELDQAIGIVIASRAGRFSEAGKIVLEKSPHKDAKRFVPKG